MVVAVYPALLGVLRGLPGGTARLNVAFTAAPPDPPDEDVPVLPPVAFLSLAALLALPGARRL